MPWTPDVVYLSGLDFFSDIVQSAGEQDWQQPSPCAGWTALDVLGHIGIATDFGTKLLNGEQPEWSPQADPPSQVVSGEPTRWWADKVEPAKNAVQGVDLTQEVDSPMGRRSIGEGLTFPALDFFIHGWDVARSFDQHVTIPDEAIAFAHQVLDQVPSEQLRSSRVFAPAVEAPPDATATQRFIAWTGRDPR